MSGRRSAAQSRFGLRMIVVFAACALAPILVFSVFAYGRTRTQLEADAEKALRRETKDLSMRLIERLGSAAEALGHVARHPEEEIDPGASSFDRIERRTLDGLPLSEDQRTDLAQGAAILIDEASDREHPLELVVLVGDGSALVGSLRFDALLSPDHNQAVQRYWIETRAGRLLYAADADGRTRTIVADHPDRAVRTRLDLDTPAGREIAMVWPVFLRGRLDHDGLRVGTAVPRDAVLAPLDEFERAFLVAVALALLGSVAIALHQIRRRLEPLGELLRVVRAVESGDYGARAHFRSEDEFDELGRSFNAMTNEVAEHVANLRRLTRVGGEMLRDPSHRAVASLLVKQAVEITEADLGLFLRVDVTELGEDETVERACRVYSAARGDGEAVWPEELAGVSLPVQNAISGEPLILERDTQRAAFVEIWDAFEGVVGKPIRALLILPMRTGNGPITTQLVLATTRPFAESRFSGRPYHSIRILRDQAAVAIRVADLVTNLRALFEGVIHLTVQAIDEKSPYTGDHCRRVPILTEQIADAVDQTEIGPFKDFSLSPEQRYELRIAALLHDCGKVATPVHVMDKATKLETIMDRIEVVRDRAEILRRDLEIGRLHARLESLGAAATGDDPELLEAIARLEDDLAFVEKCNAGGEFMDPQARDRIDAIEARHAWRDRGGEQRRLLTERDRENLKIGRGTLNPEERSVIEGHVSTTIRLLERLPFPPEMARVPDIAGAHHEHIDGSGYPKGLAHEQLDVQSRILGLADVFEALTAKDRPYKAGRTLSQTLRILEAMVADGHIDGELLAIMLRQKVHLHYAAQHMDPEQIDGVYRDELEQLTAPWAAARDRAASADAAQL